MDTRVDFSLPQRAIYWAAISFTTFLVANFTIEVVTAFLKQRSMSSVFASYTASVVAGIPLTAVVYVTNTYVAQNDNGGWDDLLRLFAICTAISVCVTTFLRQASLAVGERDPDTMQEDGTGLRETVAFLARVPKHLGKDLICVQAQDHYLEVITTQGTDLILMRFSDALNELQGPQGIQVHRSWWISKQHVTEFVRQDGKTFVLLNTKTLDPVSRTFLTQARKE